MRRRRRSGAGCPRTRSSRGSSSAGSTSVTPSSPRRPVGRLISTPACSRASGLRPDEYVISADEKSELQALGRRHRNQRARPGRPSRYEFEYERGGTLAYLAAWDVHHANLFDRVEPKTGIEPFGRLVEQVMTTEPYASAQDRLLDRRQRLARTPARLRSNGCRTVADRQADPPAGPRLLAEPDRAVLLDRATQSTHPQRPRDPRRARRAAPRVRRALPPDRPSVPLDLHPPRPQQANRPDRRPRTPARPRRLTIRTSGRVY